MANKAVNYDAVLRACNPNTNVTVSQFDQAIIEISGAMFPGCSEEDISISREDSECLAVAVCHRLGVYLPTKIIIKRLLGAHK